MEPRRRFRILKELAEGAFGKVYLAEMITGDNFKSGLPSSCCTESGSDMKRLCSALGMRRGCSGCFTTATSCAWRT